MTQDHEHEHHEHDHEHEHHHDHAEEELDYAGQIEAFRADKDDAFRFPRQPDPARGPPQIPGTPLLPGRRGAPVRGPGAGAVRRRPADLVPDPDLGQPAEAGPSRRVIRFELGGEPRRLTAYVIDGGRDGESVFVPFLDATSGHETYGAGRYLDIEPEEDGTYALDFNLAYHPSCVYSPYYSCPITPAENRLPDRIEAGERLAEGDGEGDHV